MVDNQQWICFFSQTGGEINSVRKLLGRDPDIIVTNKSDFSGVDQELLDTCGAKIICLPDRPSKAEYQTLCELFEDNCIITLHGYLRIIPDWMCEKYTIYNSHPGNIIKYPQLKGFNPQEKAFKLKLPKSGVVIHKVIPEVDCGEILAHVETDIKGLSLDEVYEKLHDTSINLWVDFLKNLPVWVDFLKNLPV